MIQRDYILRLIDQLGALLRVLLGSEGDVKRPEKAISDSAQSDDALERSCQAAIGLSFRTVKERSPDELVELFRSGGATWVSRCFSWDVCLNSTLKSRPVSSSLSVQKTLRSERFIFTICCAGIRRCRMSTGWKNDLSIQRNYLPRLIRVRAMFSDAQFFLQPFMPRHSNHCYYRSYSCAELGEQFAMARVKG
jgi:hypothetical protein